VARARLAVPVEGALERTPGASIADAVVEPSAPLPVGAADPHVSPFFRMIVGVAPVAALVITIRVSCRHSILRALSALRPGGLSPLDVRQSRPFLRRSRLLLFRHVRSGRGFEPVSADMRRLRPQGPQRLARLFSVGDEPPAFDVRLVFTDQPLLSVPGTAAAFARDALDAAPLAHVLCTKCAELF